MSKQKTKNKNEKVSARDAELFGLALDSLESKSDDNENLPIKLQRLRSLRDQFNKKKAAGLNWRRIAKLAAIDLEAYKYEIFLAATTGQAGFFIDLGKCLKGTMKSGYDNLDLTLARILSQNPSISAHNGVCELIECGHPEISEDNFRVRKKRLKELGRAIDKRDTAHESNIDEFTKGMIQALSRKKT